MVAYNFQKQFEQKIKDGSKKHTIRRHSKRRQAQRGDALQLYFGMRTKHCRKICRDKRCFGALNIDILVGKNAKFKRITIDKQNLLR